MNISLLVDYEEWKFKECGMTLHHIGRLIIAVVLRMHGIYSKNHLIQSFDL